jgi:catechol-2,3-dioxygenase
MAGIVFLRTRMLEQLRPFYVDTLGMESWLEQPGIAILAHENMLIGLQQSDVADRDGLLTFWFRRRDEVDAMHARLADVADEPPQVNARYGIYNFFARDPEGRRIECQAFLHATRAVSGVPALDP